jgi:hypothetical protein
MGLLILIEFCWDFQGFRRCTDGFLVHDQLFPESISELHFHESRMVSLRAGTTRALIKTILLNSIKK